MTVRPHPTTQDLLRYIDASPTPVHAVAETARRLDAAGFSPLAEGARWTLAPGDARYVVRGGSVLAFRVGTAPAAEAGFRIIGAHTDSPNLRLKPRPDLDAHGYRQLGVETYGGLLAYTWLDRDLGLAGAVLLRDDAAPGRTATHLLRIDRPILRIPSLAIHLDREVNSGGLKLDFQRHLPPVLGLESADGAQVSAGTLRRLLATELQVEPERVLSFDLALHDTVPATVGGLDGEFIFAPRLDNQAMCHAGLSALLRAAPAAATQLLCLYDHEEIGSGSATGAAGSMAVELLRRLAEVEGPGATSGGLPRAAAHSWQVSGDMAHALHPNHSDRHEPRHQPGLNRGPVIKVNSAQKYATTAETAALFEALCVDAGVPSQRFVTRTDLACGSTIGPISAAQLGIRTVDVGNPMLSMHSVRELAGAHDPEPMTEVMTRFFVC
ncbi:MAG: M18 family aminopeptidase [Deltaproteobacteria bacterium]|nr:M18 family aminopeptidase [Deltaproteobacteria bacterium]MCB9788971.1 M18 family aminopeptidase [Deltaproteobacteria bacterium]